MYTFIVKKNQAIYPIKESKPVISTHPCMTFIFSFIITT